jgi:hypothetical protein
MPLDRLAFNPPPQWFPPGGKAVSVFAAFVLVWNVPFDRRLAPKYACPSRAVEQTSIIIVQSQRDPIQYNKSEKEKSSMGSTSKTINRNMMYPPHDTVQHDTYMVQDVVVLPLLANDSRREFLAFLGNVDARFLELPCGDFECVDPTYELEGIGKITVEKRSQRVRKRSNELIDLLGQQTIAE